jgi:hypothetical protein
MEPPIRAGKRSHSREGKVYTDLWRSRVLALQNEAPQILSAEAEETWGAWPTSRRSYEMR